MKNLTILKTKIILIIIQFLLMTLIISGFNHSYQIYFSIDTSVEHRIIIQFLANYVIFDDMSGMIFIGVIWIIISLLPIIIYFDYKKAYSTNLSTFFLLNFFFYVFLSRYDITVFNSYFPYLIINTILLGFMIVVFSIGLSILLKSLKKRKEKKKLVQFKTDNEKSLIICPYCGTEYQSIPIFCYNCNKKLVTGEDAGFES